MICLISLLPESELIKPVPQAAYLRSRCNLDYFQFFGNRCIVPKRFLTDLVLLISQFKIMFTSNISNLQVFKLFVKFVERNTIILNGSTNMIKNSRMNY